jgi:hypothetical protein
MTTAAIALTLCACGGPIETETSQPEDVGPSKATVRTTSDMQKSQKIFDVNSTNTIFFIADTKGVQNKVAFEIDGPQGNLYQRTEAMPDATGRAVASMPVEGTWIQQFSMTGRWTANVFLDNAAHSAASVVIILR